MWALLRLDIRTNLQDNALRLCKPPRGRRKSAQIRHSTAFSKGMDESQRGSGTDCIPSYRSVFTGTCTKLLNTREESSLRLRFTGASPLPISSRRVKYNALLSLSLGYAEEEHELHLLPSVCRVNSSVTNQPLARQAVSSTKRLVRHFETFPDLTCRC
jgi:hypothetical protein